MAVGVDVGGRRDDAQDRVGPLWQILDAVGHGCRSGSSLNGSSIASSWPLPLDRKTRPISAAPSNTDRPTPAAVAMTMRSEEHTSELQSLMRISYAVFCLKKQTNTTQIKIH